ncbi:MAG: cytochrome C oxidase subunit II [Candidatus Muproteobacteria bacterium RBG_16_62_13]|uniref:Cytochrome C oxidase subunit II n=1 Tax=Candidatus Muproteobacteria bacterium RBG_16_62_13 TaxID=1817756 RepID=A0A1F6T6Y3_9PROT|nr:MAG: cytochrome C oxidase subunit II [Candidatus Muproteobacteria bacterium RBG_16_62_13]
MSLTPPSERLWWKEPIERVELLWVSLALLWALIMFVMMPYWHVYGKQNLSNEAYRTTPEMFSKKVDAMVEKYTVRKETAREYPVVAPPAGSDVYLLARLWEWYPILELEKGKKYRLHISSMDWMHGFSLQPENINVQVIPGYELVMTVTPNKTGEFSIVCNEYCGINHHKMLGRIYVK